MKLDDDPVEELDKVETVRLTIRIPKPLLEQIKDSARRHYRSLNQEIIESLVYTQVDLPGRNGGLTLT